MKLGKGIHLTVVVFVAVLFIAMAFSKPTEAKSSAVSGDVIDKPEETIPDVRGSRNDRWAGEGQRRPNF